MKKNIAFDDEPLGTYSDERINVAWNNPPRIMGADAGRANIVIDPVSQDRNVLQIKYPKGKVGQEKDGGGAQWRLRFDAPLEKCTIQYQVMFPEAFNFVKGGKLPGLCGGSSPGGGKKSDGSDGFSARIMWRERGHIFQYMYWMERALEKSWGDDLPWTKRDGDQSPFRFVPGKWHTLVTEIILNTPGERDGLITSWLDGNLALSHKGAFRAKGALFGIDSLNFTTFFGGNTLDWAPVKDEFAYFADFSISGSNELI